MYNRGRVAEKKTVTLESQQSFSHKNKQQTKAERRSKIAIHDFRKTFKTVALLWHVLTFFLLAQQTRFI